MLLLCSTDLPARALVANMKAYNGKYSCTSCEDSGEEGSNPLHRVWPFNAESTTRSKATVMKAVCDAVQQQTSVSFVWSVIYMNGMYMTLFMLYDYQVLGYKGFPILCWHPNFDVVKGMVTDYLHCVLLGVTKTLLNSWLDPKNSSFDFYIGREVSKFCLS